MTVLARLARRLSVLLALLIACQLLAMGGTAGAAPPASSDLYRGILPDQRAAVQAATEGTLSTYTISVDLDPASSSLSGSEDVRFVNQTGQSLTSIPFRLYPNADYYGAGALTVNDARVNGVAVTPALSVAGTVMQVPLPTPLPPRETAVVAMTFTTVVPADSRGSFGIFNNATAYGTWVLADWYPIVAGFEPGTGWRLDVPVDNVDPTFSDAALYDVTITAPSNLVVVTTGSEMSAKRSGDRTHHHAVSGPAREFGAVVDDNFVPVTGKAGKTTVTSYANPNNVDAARAALSVAIEALEIYSKQFGAYPYQELDVVDVPLSGALGVSWTGIIFLNGDLIYHARVDAYDPDRFRYLVVHEIGHQWWGALVGSNSNDHTFLSEGLTNASFVTFIAATDGADAARTAFQSIIADAYLTALAKSGDGVVDVRAGSATGGPSSGVLNYGKAAIGFIAIREQIGADAFLAALQNYVREYRFKISTPGDLRGEFEAASGEQLDTLWTFW
ncbi:MAG TPA: M1 family metallopeptidase, partial [Thermomicrobiales bacterium]|nr:M1 family metallopeptidase [Thermomicrobiales bacterium]